MKSSLMGAACLALSLATATPSLFAQLQDNTQKTMTCNNGDSDNDRAHHCEIREQTVPAVGRLTIDATRNGGVTVKGWLQSSVLVRARIDAQGDTESAAAAMASQVSIDASGGEVKAMGPEPVHDSGWSVGYEVFVPQNTDLTLKAHNGGLSVADVRGQLHFDVTNGGVHLKRVAGDVSGNTVNGGIQVDLVGSTWEGRQMEIGTHNGGVTVTMPSYYGAHVLAETNMGGIQSDFPMALDGGRRPRQADFNVGSGGPLIHITTGNGSVRIKKSESQ